MAASNPYTVTVKRRENSKPVEIQVNPSNKQDANWQVKHRSGNLYFGTKDDVKTYLKRKYAVVED